MTPKCALLLLLAVVPFAAAMPLDEDADGRADYAAEADSYALARDAVAGEDYFPALSEPADGEFEYERPPGLLPAIVYFQEAPSLAQAPSGPAPLGPSKLANKVGELPLPSRRAPPPQQSTTGRLVPALVFLLPNRGVAPGLEAPRFRQLPPLPEDDDVRQEVPQPWPYLQAPLSRAPALPFHTVDEAEVPEPATEVRPPPVPESEITVAVIPAAEPNTSDVSDESDESKESQESTEAPQETSSTEPETPLTTLAPPRARRSPVGGNANANSGASSSAKSSASSSSGSFSSASSQASSYSEPIYFGGPTNSGSYASSSSQSSSGGGTGFGGAPAFGAPASGYDNFGAGSAYNPQGSQGFGSSGGTGHGGAGGEGNLLNRFGSLDEPGPASVQHSGTSTGKGVHSSASSSIDSTGKVTYHVQAGKF